MSPVTGDISYTEERAKQMLFSDEPMGEEKYYLYADLSDTDISAYNFQTLNGKRIGVLKGTQPEVMLTEWEQKYNLETTHVNIANNDDVKRKLADHFPGGVFMGCPGDFHSCKCGKIWHLLCDQQGSSGDQRRTG